MTAFKIDAPQTAYEVLTVDNVKAALNGLVYSAQPRRFNPLAHLLVVNQAVHQPLVASGTLVRLFALSQLLTTLISREVRRHRTALEVLSLPQETSRSDAQQAIKQDAETACPELMGWSWLYYHFVRVEFNIGLKDFTRWAAVDERTLRRYQEHAIWRLTDCLIEQERSTWEMANRRRLYAKLPTSAPVPLLGRESSLKQAERFLQHSLPHQVQIVGVSGIGKTAFVQEITHRLIHGNLIDDLLWVDRPSDVHMLRQQLREFLECRHDTQMQRILFVFEDIDCLSHDLESLERLLSDLSAAVVLLTAQSPLYLRNIGGYIYLNELREDAACAYIRLLLSNSYREACAAFTEQDVTTIWAATSGNPGHIRRSVFEWRCN